MGLTKKDISLVVLVLLSAFLVFFNHTMITPAFPSVMKQFEIEQSTVQWLISGYSLVEAVIIPLNAFLLGKFGARKIIVSTMIIFFIGSVICSCAPTFGLLMFGRVVQACATGALVPSVFTILLIVFPKEHRGKAMGLVGLVIAAAPALGPTIAGVLIDSVGREYTFVIIACLSLVLSIIHIAKFRFDEKFENIKFDFLSVVLMSFGMLSLLFGLSQIAAIENMFIPLGCIVAGVILISLFGIRQIRMETPVLKVSTLFHKPFAISSILIMMFEGLIVAMGACLPTFVQNALGCAATVSGLVMLPGSIIGAIACTFSGPFYDKHGARGISIFGGIMLIAGYACFYMFNIDSPIWFVAVSFAIAVVALEILINPIDTWGINSLPNKDMVHGNAIISTLEQVGGSLFTGLIVGLTALGPQLAGAGASAAEVTAAGCSVSFVCLLILAVLIFIVILVFVHDHEDRFITSKNAKAYKEAYKHSKLEAKEVEVVEKRGVMFPHNKKVK